jgi:hypothetical protein
MFKKVVPGIGRSGTRAVPEAMRAAYVVSEWIVCVCGVEYAVRRIAYAGRRVSVGARKDEQRRGSQRKLRGVCVRTCTSAVMSIPTHPRRENFLAISSLMYRPRPKAHLGEGLGEGH